MARPTSLKLGSMKAKMKPSYSIGTRVRTQYGEYGTIMRILSWGFPFEYEVLIMDVMLGDAYERYTEYEMNAVRTEYFRSINMTRNELIEICDAALVPKEKWRHEKASPNVQMKIGGLRSLLLAGCNFEVDKLGKSYLDVKVGVNGSGMNWGFRIPSQELLSQTKGKDWC